MTSYIEWPAQEQHNSFYSGLSGPATESIIAPGFPYALPLFTFRTFATGILRTETPIAEFRYNVILADIFQMTSKFEEIVLPFDREENSIISAPTNGLIMDF